MGTGETEELQPSLASGLGLAVVQGPWALKTKPRSYQGLVMRGFPLRLCGQTYRKPKSERKMTKSEREGRTQRMERVKVRLENKSSKQEPAEWQKGKQTIKSRTKCGRGSRCKGLISQTCESLTLEQRFHSPAPGCRALRHNGNYEEAGEQSNFHLASVSAEGRPQRDLALCWLRGGAWPLAAGWGASEWAGTRRTSLESCEASQTHISGRNSILGRGLIESKEER